MRIALVNWAKVWDGAAVGGGVNGYAQGVAIELTRRGHEVLWLCAGTAFDASGKEIGPPRVVPHEDWLGVRVFEIVNSPVLAPGVDQFKDPAGEIAGPAMEALVERWAAEHKPDVVHWNNIEGFTAGCPAAARRGAPRSRQVFSLHNYHTICPQVYLLQGHRRPCLDFRGGLSCDGCVPSHDPVKLRRRLAGLPETPEPAPRFPGESRGSTSELLAASRPHPWSEAGLSIPAWRPLLNVIPSEPQAPANDYGRRRAAMVRMLSGCDAVLAVSQYVRDRFAAIGVPAERLRVMPIGSRLPEFVAARPEALTPPGPVEEIASGRRPLRLTYMGYNNWFKGLQMLQDAIELLTPEYASRLHISILALGGEAAEPGWRRLEPRLAGLRLVHGYKQADLPWLLGRTDLGVVPSVWWDNGPQTVIEFLACRVPVLAAELGGIPDVVRHGVNGLLFRGNDRWDLARTLAGVLRDPASLGRLRAGVGPVRTIAQHVDELLPVYGVLPGAYPRPDPA